MYEQLGKEVFGRRQIGGQLGHLFKGMASSTFYDIEILQEQVRKALDSLKIPRDEYFIEAGTPICKVYEFHFTLIDTSRGLYATAAYFVLREKQLENRMSCETMNPSILLLRTTGAAYGRRQVLQQRPRYISKALLLRRREKNSVTADSDGIIPSTKRSPRSLERRIGKLRRSAAS